MVGEKSIQSRFLKRLHFLSAGSTWQTGKTIPSFIPCVLLQARFFRVVRNSMVLTTPKSGQLQKLLEGTHIFVTVHEGKGVMLGEAVYLTWGARGVQLRTSPWGYMYT